MYSVKKYLKEAPWTGLISMITDRTHQNLKPSHCELLNLTNLGGLTTEVTIRIRRSKSNASIDKTVDSIQTYTYQRLNPESFFSSPYVINDCYLPNDTFNILKHITDKTGITFSPDDFIHSRYDDYGNIVLNSNPASLRWVGTLTLNIHSPAKALNSVITKDSFNTAFVLPYETGITYSHTHDFTKYRYYLNAFNDSPNGLYLDKLLWVLKEVTLDDWKCNDNQIGWNLCDRIVDSKPSYTLVYAGDVISEYSLRTDLSRLIVFKMNPVFCTNVKNYLLLHYD